MGKYGQTEIHPAALALTLLVGMAMLFVRRDRAALGFLIVACLVTHAQRIVIAGLDFSMLRIVILFGWLRILSRGETAHYRFQPVDALLPTWLLFSTLAYIFGPRGSMDAFINRLGASLDAAGTYFLFRILLRDIRDVQRAISAFGLLALVMVGPMLVENLTGRNIFSVLGGVNEFTRVRDGRLRCQASFSHPIMAGNFGASTAALVAALWLAFPKQRLRHGLSVVAGVSITVLSASGGPVFALGAAILGWALWPVRQYMGVFRWSAVVTILVTHLVRDQPVWHLIGRASSIVGGTGFHRVKLITNFFEHFHEWWFLGALSTAHWKKGLGASDITNHYILEGIRGGLPTLISFIAMLAVSFRTVGRAMRKVASRSDWPPEERRQALILTWGVGACVGVHAVAFIGVAYFGQLLSILYLHLALIPSMASAIDRAASRAPARPPPTRARDRPERSPRPSVADLVPD